MRLVTVITTVGTGEERRRERKNGQLNADSALGDSQNLQGNTITVLPPSFWVIHTLVARKNGG